MDLAHDAEIEELESGLTSGFWARLQSHVAAEWGPGGARFQAAVLQAASGGKTEAESLAYLRMVILAQQEIQRLLAWPQERLQRLKPPPAPVGPITDSRRGGL